MTLRSSQVKFFVCLFLFFFFQFPPLPLIIMMMIIVIIIIITNSNNSKLTQSTSYGLLDWDNVDITSARKKIYY